jgi:hypothetical protein
MSAIRDLADQIETYNGKVVEMNANVAAWLRDMLSFQDEIVAAGGKIGLKPRAIRADLTKIDLRGSTRGQDDAEEQSDDSTGDAAVVDQTSFPVAALTPAELESVEDHAPDESEPDPTPLPAPLLPGLRNRQAPVPMGEQSSASGENDEDVF